MRLPGMLADAVNHNAVVSAELRSHNRFLPPRWGDVALESKTGEVASWFASVIRREVIPDADDVVMARKNGGGARPLNYMSLRDRLAFRAAISIVEHDVQLSERTDEAYEAFIRSPLSVDNCRHILKADIAAFYQYIDHERLVDEVVAQTGSELAPSFAMELLQASSGRRFGLPQMTDPSDVLSELYIEPMRRVLSRAGFQVARFADDFRVACRTYNEALEAREVAERAARELGLVLNEYKTSTPSIEKYRESLDEVKAAEVELFTFVEGDTDAFDVELGYDDAEVSDIGDSPWTLGHEGAGVVNDETAMDDEETSEEPVHEAQIEAAKLAVKVWLTEGETELGDIGANWTPQVRSILLRKALKVLVRTQDASALDHATGMLVREPHLTPQICKYLCSLMVTTEQQAVVGTLDKICRRKIVSVWQSLWISYCAGELPAVLRGGQNDHVTWLKRQLASEHPALAAEATLALARRRLITTRAVVRVLNRISTVHRPTVVMALAALGSGDAASIGANQIERWQAEWALGKWAAITG